MRKLIYLLCLGISLTLVFSCKKNGEEVDNLESILLGKDTLTMNVGDVAHLDYKIKPATYDSTTLAWTSSDTSVIAVNKGTLKAKKEGKSTITVKNQTNTVTVSCLITVIDPFKIGLIAYYPFNNTVADSSGNANNGTAYNLTAVSNRYGKVNSAYYFNGYNSYIAVPDKQPLRLYGTNFTLNAWIKLDANNSSYGSMILNKHFTGADNGWTWSITGQSSNPLSVGFFGPGGGSSNAYGTKTVGLNSWHMVTCVYNVATQKLMMYVDGVLDNSSNDILSPNPLISANLFIGCDNPTVWSNGYFFQGAMDEIRMYSRALSVNEIKALYNLKR